MKNLKQWKFRIAFGCLALGALCILPVSAQDAPDVGPHPAQPLKPMESHIGNVTGHAKDAKMNYRRYCAGCHGDLGDGNGENAPWLDPKPRDFTIATFKCRSTPTGTLPTDQDLFNTIGRGVTEFQYAGLEQLLAISSVPIWSRTSRLSRRVGKKKRRGSPSRFQPSLR